MLLEVKDIHKNFGNKEVLKGISFKAEAGKAFGLLGRNGAGKTTTIRTIMDIFHADSGEILLDGEQFNPNKIQIGYLPEEKGLYAKRTVLEQIVYFGRLRGISKKEAIKNANIWLEKLGVREYANVKVDTLSKGNQQKIQLVAALVNNPDIVILDEPFSGLDPVNSKVLQDVVIELIKMNKIVIFSSHQMSYVEEFCNDIVIIDQGKIVLKGKIDDIKKEYGNNQILIKSSNKSNSQIEAYINNHMNDLAKVTTSDKNGVMVVPKNGKTQKMILQRLLEMQDLELDYFETYKPSLNDIFVERVGNN